MSGGRKREQLGTLSRTIVTDMVVFVPRIGCIFVDGDSSLNTPGAEPRRVCAVHKRWDAGSPGWSSHGPAGREMGYVEALSPS